MKSVLFALTGILILATSSAFAQSFEDRAKASLEQERQQRDRNLRKGDSAYNQEILRAVPAAIRKMKTSLVQGSLQCLNREFLEKYYNRQQIDHCEFTTAKGSVCKIVSYVKRGDTYSCDFSPAIKGPAQCRKVSEQWGVSCYDSGNRLSQFDIPKGTEGEITEAWAAWPEETRSGNCYRHGLRRVCR